MNDFFGKDLSIQETPIPGLLVLDLAVHGDERGWFKENWQREKMLALGMPDFMPVQQNVSFNQSAGVMRGLHAEPWDKFVSVASGRIFAAWVDLREGDSFGTTFYTEITPGRAVFVPCGVANGLQTLTTEVAYTYLVNQHWSPTVAQTSRFLNLQDPTVKIPWPIPPADWVVSESDQKHPVLSEIIPYPKKKILVIGKTGQLARSLRKLLDPLDGGVFLGRDEADLSDRDWLQGINIQDYSAVINAVAYTNADAAEAPEEAANAWRVNATAVLELAKACDDARVPLVQVSSDYVFGVNSDFWLTEESPVGPLNVYGSSKVAAENSVSRNSRHYILRTSWLFGEGKNFVRTMSGFAAAGKPVSVVADQVGRMTDTDDLAVFILHLIRTGAEYGIYNFSGSGEPASWFEIAQLVYGEVAGSPELVTSVSTEEYAESLGGRRFAARPKNSRLDLTKAQNTGFEIPDHLESVRAYIRDQARKI